MAKTRTDRDREMELRRPFFELCLLGRPVSAQAKNRRLLLDWKASVASAAAAAWPPGEPPPTFDVVLQVTQYSERRITDRDNLIKPIQDALQSIAYVNDRQVVDSVSRWRDIEASFRVRYVSRTLALAFSDGREFLHVEVWESTGDRK